MVEGVREDRLQDLQVLLEELRRDVASGRERRLAVVHVDGAPLQHVLADLRGVGTWAGVGKEALVQTSLDLDVDVVGLRQVFQAKRLPLVQRAEDRKAAGPLHQSVHAAAHGVDALQDGDVVGDGQLLLLGGRDHLRLLVPREQVPDALGLHRPAPQLHGLDELPQD